MTENHLAENAIVTAMKYTAIAVAALHIGSSATALVAAPTPAAPQKTNVLFIIADDLRTELGCYGAGNIHSPNIDRLAAGGLVFERAYCQVSVCNPSRNSLLSGARPDTTRSLDNRTFLRSTMPQVVTLPQHFKDHGWHAASVGKIFHHSEREPGDDPQSWSEPSWYRGQSHRHWFSSESLALVERLKRLPANERPKLARAAPFEAADEPDESYPDGQTATKAIQTLRQLKDRRFFLGVGFVKPHLPFTCPRKYWDLYPSADVKLPENCHPPKGAPAPAIHDAYELRTYGTVPPTGDIPRELALNLVRGYRACVSFLDAQIGRVLDELDRLDLRENTIVVLLGDHGYHLGENGVYTKMTNFELGTRVPLILGIPKGRAAGRRRPAERG